MNAPRIAALFAERAALEAQLARVAKAIAEAFAEGAEADDHVTPLERQRVLRSLDRARARAGR